MALWNWLCGEVDAGGGVLFYGLRLISWLLSDYDSRVIVWVMGSVRRAFNVGLEPEPWGGGVCFVACF